MSSKAVAEPSERNSMRDSNKAEMPMCCPDSCKATQLAELEKEEVGWELYPIHGNDNDITKIQQ